MSPQRTRLVDVAREAGVSRTTVSFVLNGRDVTIPQTTRERVLEAAARLGYRPNATARALATGRTNRLGVAFRMPEAFSLDNSYFVNVIMGAAAGATRRDYNLLLHSARHFDWRTLHEDVTSGATDGVLLVGRAADDPLAHQLLQDGFPTVCVSCSVDHPRCNSVDCDNVEGGRLAVRHLTALGHKHIALFSQGDCYSWARERVQGARIGMQESGLPTTNLRVTAWGGLDPRHETWLGMAVEFLKRTQPRPTALIVCDEDPASVLVERLPRCGIRVPDDLAVVCFNSTNTSDLTKPPLSAVWQPVHEIGTVAAEMLVDLLEGRELRKTCIRMPVRLDVRESCGAGLRGQKIGA